MQGRYFRSQHEAAGSRFAVGSQLAGVVDRPMLDGLRPDILGELLVLDRLAQTS